VIGVRAAVVSKKMFS